MAGLTRTEFARLFEREARLLWVVAAACGPRAAAADVVQEAAAIALSRLDTFSPGTGFRAWMTRIVRHVASNEQRRLRRAPQPASDLDPVAPPPPEPGIAGSGELRDLQREFDDEVVRALRTLPEEQRACLLLQVVAGLELAEIGATLDLKPGTVASHLHRARHALREQLRGGTHGRHASGAPAAGPASAVPIASARRALP